MPRKLPQIDGWYVATGCIHMHTTASDGSATLDELAAYANETGLDFVFVTDHMTLKHRDDKRHGWYQNTLVIVGYEHNDPADTHHFLVFKSPGVYDSQLTPAEYVAAAARDDAISIIAHPDEIRDRMEQYPPYPWTDWSVEGFTGIELWNQMSEWMERLTPTNRLWRIFSPRKSMYGPPATTLRRWDDLNRDRKIVGVGSVDAHAFPVAIGPLTVRIFPYKVHFRSIRSYLLLSETLPVDAHQAEQHCFDALREARLFFANVRWGDPIGFSFTVENSERRVTIGESLESANRAVARVAVPRSASIRLIHNSQVMSTAHGHKLEAALSEPGLYRVEAFRRRRGWIYSNHIRVGC